ncbi:MAG: hypothetical protein JNK65_07495, partial [Deltaproteobacteria bacterium]|nr:hypothetical protein [Deltaproteobacteria bacterium]
MSFLLERHDSLIHRLSGSSLNETSLSTTQRSVDQMVGGFLNQATRVETLVPMILGGFTYRLAHAGLMSATQSFGRAAQTLLSSSLALGAEVTVFEESGRLFHPQHSPRRLQQWGTSYLNFGALKMGGHLALGQNLIVSHLIQDSSMVLANQVVGRLGLTPLPQENLFQQFLEAESMNLHMALGMGLAHRFLGNSFMAFERSLSLVSHRASLSSSLSIESIRSDSSSAPKPRWALRAALASLVGIFTFATPHLAEAATRIRSEGSENIGLYLLGLGLSGVALGMAISRRQMMTLTEFPRVNDLLVRAQHLYAADSYQEYQAWRVEARDLCQAMNEVEREKLLEVLKESLTNGLPPACGGGLYVLSLLYPHLPVERRAEFFRYVVDNMHDETPAVVQITSIVLSEIYKNLSSREQVNMVLNLSAYLTMQSLPIRSEIIQAWMRLVQNFGENEQICFVTSLSSSFQATDHSFWDQLLAVVKNPARVELFKQVTQRLVDLGGIQNTADIALLDLMRPHLNRLETVQDAEIHDWIACLRMQHHPELKRVGDEVYFHLFPSERKSSKGRGGGNGLN